MHARAINDNTIDPHADLRRYLINIQGQLITASDEIFRKSGFAFPECWRVLQTAHDCVSYCIHLLEDV